MKPSIHLNKLKKTLWTKFNPERSVFVNTTNASTAEVGQDLLPEDFVSENLKAIAQKFIRRIQNEGVTHVVVNKKKVVMQKVYYNIISEIKHYSKVKVLYVDELKGGTFTNPCSKNFLNAAKVFVILTRSYNKKEINILKQLEKVHIDNIVLTLNVGFVNNSGFTLNLSSIKTLYLFLYALKSQRLKTHYADFVKDYQFTEKELNFEPLND